MTYRSYLFVPSLKLSMMEKAVSSNADCVIFDLEDAVALSEKDVARENVGQALTTFFGEKPIYVRMNDVSTPYWKKDLITAVGDGASGVIIPKAEDAEGVRQVCDMIRAIKENAQIDVIPLVETAKGIEFAYEIAKADVLVTHLAFGSIDFSLDIGCELTGSGQELLYARSRLVIASKAAGRGRPIDAVFQDLQNEEGLKNETVSAKQLGFGGKLVIHPKQVEIVNTLFTPNQEKLVEANHIVEQFEEAERQGLASITVNNQFVDYPVYKKAKELLNKQCNRFPEVRHGNENIS